MTTAPEARQLGLPLAFDARLGRADFVVGEANRRALAAIDAWRQWPGRVLLLTGPSGSGKTHLAGIFAGQSGATVLPAAALAAGAMPEPLPGGALAVDDIDSAPAAGTGLFHLLNRARQAEAFVLLTGRDPDAALKVGPPDLASRLRAAQPVTVGAPDDELLRRVLAKHFADRRLPADEALLDYLATRIERSFAAAADIAARLDSAALAAGRPVTRAFAATILKDATLADLWNDGEDDAT